MGQHFESSRKVLKYEIVRLLSLKPLVEIGPEVQGLEGQMNPSFDGCKVMQITTNRQERAPT